MCATNFIWYACMRGVMHSYFQTLHCEGGGRERMSYMFSTQFLKSNNELFTINMYFFWQCCWKKEKLRVTAEVNLLQLFFFFRLFLSVLVMVVSDFVFII